MAMANNIRAPPPPPLTSLPYVQPVDGRSSPRPSSTESATTTSHSDGNRNRTDSFSSKHSSVHFDLDTSNPALQPPKGTLRTPTAANLYQPAHPSTLHTSTVPPPPKTAPARPTNRSHNSGLVPFPTSPSTSLTSSPNSLRPTLPRARSSQDRRVWSESLPVTRSHRSGSLIHNGKRASKVTGGYETSSADEEGTAEDFSSHGQQAGSSATPLLPANLELSPGNAHAGPSRPRAKSLISTVGRERQGSDASGTSRDAKRRRQDPRGPKRHDSHRRATSRSASARSNRSPPQPSAQLPSSRSDTHFGLQNGSPRSIRLGPARSPLVEGVSASPSRSPSTRVNNLDKVREAASSPEGGKKAKGKEKENLKKPDGLAASLGLGIGGIQDMALNPDQLYSLLSDTDVSSALRMMNSPHLPASRPPHLNEWSNSAFFSPPVTRPGSPGAGAGAGPPTRSSPYLVSAPPPLTGVAQHGRDRSMSTASSILPPVHSTWGSSPRNRRVSDAHSTPPQEAFGSARRRASSKAGPNSDGQGGHVPFTHHVPIVTVDEDAAVDPVDTTEVLPAIIKNDVGSSRSGDSTPKKDEKEKKGRLSGLFHLGKRKSNEVTMPEPLLLHKDQKTDKQKAEEKAREREKFEKDMERRRLEQERRDEELAQERRFRALTQVAAHPTSERMAYRTGAHLRAYYQHVYEGVDNPPKLNPLAVLRWRIKTDEQNEARAKWEQTQLEDQAGRSDKSGAQYASPRSNGRAAHAGEHIHSSPMSIGANRKSVESARSTSLGSLRRSTDMSKKNGGSDNHHSIRNWKYSVDDIVSYKDSNGVVNYFIPPRRSHPDVEVLTEDENEDGFETRPFTPNARSQGDGMSSKRDDMSSMAGSSRKDLHSTRTAIKTASNISLLDAEGVMNGDRVQPLSRSASIETGRGGLGRNRITHRSHQSLSAVGQGALTHALKQPFEKLSSVAKKQRPPPSAAGGDKEEVLDDIHRSESVPRQLNIHASPHPQSAAMVNKSSRATMNSVNSRQREQQGFFRRHNPYAGPDSYTDEEGNKEFHLRKLFLKGQRVLSSLEDVGRMSKKSEVDLVRLKRDARETEMLALEAALLSESTFRERQAEVPRQTQIEIDAQERIKKLENEIYAERVEHLEIARQRLDPINTYLMYIDETIKQFLLQVDFLHDEARIAADVEVQWDVDTIRRRYANSARRRSGEHEDEHRDTLPPLRTFDSPHSGSDNARRQRPSPQNSLSLARRHRTQSQSQSQSQSQPNSPTLSSISSSALTIPRRRQSLFRAPTTMLDPQLAIPLRHHPRRTYLNPAGTERVNPVQQAELFIAFGKGRLEDMDKEKEGMKRDLDKMIATIEGMIKQKESVRLWAREILERNNSRQVQLERLLREESTAALINSTEWRDHVLNNTIQFISVFIRSTFWLYYQAKAELSFYLSPFKPSTYCRNKMHKVKAVRARPSSDADGDGDGDGVEDDEIEVRMNALTDRDSQRRVPILGLLSVGAVGLAVFFFYYGA